MQAQIDRANAEFWNELCGSNLARSVGVVDRSAESLRRFDDAYLRMYPYLERLVGVDGLRGRDTLEVGLGYGTLSQRIAEAGARYHGLDLSPGPVAMVNHRLELLGLPATAVQGSAHALPFPEERFDCVVSIGCFHHTGDVQRCIDETYRVLRPGGRAVLMVYNKFSYRQWRHWPRETLRELFNAWGLSTYGMPASIDQRHAYDHNGDGDAAPETAFLSAAELKRMLGRFEHVTCQKQNCDGLSLGAGRATIDRAWLLSSLGRAAGLDLYVQARKPAKWNSRRRLGHD